jgi:hypothetical protein
MRGGYRHVGDVQAHSDGEGEVGEVNLAWLLVATIIPKVLRTAKSVPGKVSRSRTSGSKVSARVKPTRLTKIVKNKLLIRPTQNSTRSVRRSYERRVLRWFKAHCWVRSGDERIVIN